jgi:cephalosporin hydroxylase
VAACPNVLVSLDSDHRKDHVLNELRLYSRLIPVGSYIVVEDTDINGHPVFPGYGPGPWEAVEIFLKENPAFAVDEDLNNTHLMSMHPRGYLKRVK